MLQMFEVDLEIALCGERDQILANTDCCLVSSTSWANNLQIIFKTVWTKLQVIGIVVV